MQNVIDIAVQHDLPLDIGGRKNTAELPFPALEILARATERLFITTANACRDDAMIAADCRSIRP